MNLTTTTQRLFWLKMLFWGLLPWLMNAQNPGPAGVGNHTGAGGHPRNVLWLRADAGVFPNAGCTGTITDGGNVNCWQDQSGNGLHATLTSTDKPVYLATGLGGRPALRFDNDAIDGPERRISVPDDPLLDFSTAVTIIIVAQQDFAATNPKGLYYKRQSPGSQEAYGLWRNGGGTMVARISENGTTAFNVNLGMPTVGTPFIYSYVYDAGEPANNKLTAILNSTSSNTGTNVNSIFNSEHPLNIGTFNVGDNRSFPGRISEMILYSATLTPPQRIIIENYLSQKYGANIGANDNFGNATSYHASFVQDVIGIGTVNGTVKHSVPTTGSGALYLAEAHGTLDETNEFVILAHNGVAHAVSTSDLGIHVTERWARSWYIEKNRNGGVVDDANTDIKLNFDFGDAGISLGSVTEYALLYRPTNSGNFEIVSTASLTRTIENTDQVSFTLTNVEFSTGYYTIGKASTIPTSRTWYLLRTDGVWTDVTNWTLDASTAPIYINPGAELPGPIDNVVIRNGRRLEMNVNGVTIKNIDVRGEWDIVNTSGHIVTGRIDGNGIIRIRGTGSPAVDNFPSGNVNGSLGFANVTNGGTLEIYGPGITMNVNRTFRNVRIKMNSSATLVKFGANFTLNGNLNIHTGDFRFDNDLAPANRTITVYGDITVQPNGRISVNNANNQHDLFLHGNFTNNCNTATGVAFTNRTVPTITDLEDPSYSYYTAEATNGYVVIHAVNDLEDQTFQCNQVTRFYRIQIDKGTNDTYILNIQADAPDKFYLLGPANDNNDTDMNNVTGMMTGVNTNALGLKGGTVRLKENIYIPVLNRNGNYCIGAQGRLWIDGADVRKTAATAVVPYGILQISNGYFRATGNSGITLRLDGRIIAEGGSIQTNQIRTSVLGTTAIGGYYQTGGSVEVNGALGAGAPNPDYYLFSLTYPSSVFLMQGGTLLVRGTIALNNRTGGASGNMHGGLIFINSDPAQQNVTGGRVIVEISTNPALTNGQPHKITSKAPFYNLTIRKSLSGGIPFVMNVGGTSGDNDPTDFVTLPAQPLKVLNELIIEGNETAIGESTVYESVQLVMVRTISVAQESDDALSVGQVESSDLYVGGSFYIENTSLYDCLEGGTFPYNSIASAPTHMNTTYFNQTIATGVYDTLYWGNPTTGDEDMLELGHVVVNRNSGNELRSFSQLSRPNAVLTVDINGNFSVLSGTYDQGRLTTRLWGNITNYDRMGTYYTAGPYPTPMGTPSLAQVRFREDPGITITTNNNAVFGNIRFNVAITTPITFNSNMYIERMEYMRGIIYIGSNNLKVDEMWNLNNDANSDTDLFVETPAVSSLLRVVDTGRSTGTGTNQRIMIITNGLASDGGLTLKVTGNTTNSLGDDVRNNRETITFPIGFAGPTFTLATWTTTSYYRPAQLKVTNFVDDGYVTVRPVRGVLQTTNLAGGEVLQHHWRVTHSDFTTPPTVSWRFYYRNRIEAGVADLPTGSPANFDITNYVPGKVLDGMPFTRSYESDPNITNNVVDGEEDFDGVFATTIANTRAIVFNGFNVGTTNDGLFGFGTGAPGITLENANYTTGVANRFVGAPTVYYSRKPGCTPDWGLEWNDPNDWSTVTFNGPAATGFPGPGDVARIKGTGGCTGGGHEGFHWYDLDNGHNINCAIIIFEDISDLPTPHPWRPRIWADPARTITASKITGRGELFLRMNDTNVTQVYADIGEFAAEPLSVINYRHQGTDGSTINLPTNLNTYPNLDFESSGGTRFTRVTHAIKVNYDLKVGQNARAIIDNNAEIGRDLRHRDASTGRVILGQSGNWTVSVGRDIVLGTIGLFEVTVQNTTPSSRLHTLRVGRNIQQGSDAGTIIDLYNGTGTNNNAILELNTTQNGSYWRAGGLLPEFFRVRINKGTNQTPTFTFNNTARILGSANTVDKPIEFVNGTLIVNDQLYSDAAASTNLALSSGGANLQLPNLANPLASSGSSALIVQNGTLTVSGNTGILLDGLLRINGGTLDMSGGNNFIQYSSSGNAVIEVSSGSLIVGSQIRRPTDSEGGNTLKYRQTGGTVLIGASSSGSNKRGMFEILNPGSEFTYTGGSLTIRRQNGATAIPSLYLNPVTYNVTGSTINIFDGSTPTGQTNFLIYSAIELNNLNINGANNPTARISTLQLSVGLPLETGTLTISTGNTFDCNGVGLNLRGDLVNNGTFISSGNDVNQQTTTFNASSDKSITGTGTFSFWNLTKNNTNTLNVGTMATPITITILNDLKTVAGTFATHGSTVNLKGDWIHDATHTSNATGPGIIFNGSAQQKLERSAIGESVISVMNVNNSSGVIIQPTSHDFFIDNRLILSAGIFDIGGNLIKIDQDAIIQNGSGGTGVTDFNFNRMIQTNSSIKDFGVRKFFPDGFTGEFVYPVGLVNYTPVRVNITSIGSGPNKSITARPVNDIPLGITDDDETVCAAGTTTPASNTALNDLQNVLSYYWILKAINVSGLNAEAITYYHDDDFQVTAPYTVHNYGPARLLNASSTWDKVPTAATDFNETAKTIRFVFTGANDAGISGIYTAGVTVSATDGTTVLGSFDGCNTAGAFPNTVPTYTTLTSGYDDYTDVAPGHTWQAPLPPTGGPVGSDVVVKSGFTLRLDINNVRIRKTTIEPGAILEIQGTENHNLGFVEGGGTIRLISNTSAITFPAGDYSEFLPDNTCTTGDGSLWYAGTGSYTVLADIPAVRDLIFTGSGSRNFPNQDCIVCKDLLITESGGTLTANMETFDKNITVHRDIIQTGGTFLKGNGNVLTVGRDYLMTMGPSSGSFSGDAGNVSVGRNLSVGTSTSFSINATPATLSVTQAWTNAGTINLGNGINSSAASFSQTGGTFNHGNNANMTISGSFSVTGGTFNGGSSGTGNFISVGGNLTKNAAATFNTSSTNLRATGGATQTFTFGGSATFRNLTINKTGNVLVLSGASNVLTLNHSLTWTGNGIIITAADNPCNTVASVALSASYLSNLRLASTVPATNVTGYNASRYVSGALTRLGLTNGSDFTFPVGDHLMGNYKPTSVFSVNNGASSAGDWTAGYFKANPQTTFGVTAMNNNVAGSLAVSPNRNVSQLEYWVIRGSETNSTARVRITWDASSAVGPSLAEWAELRIARLNNTRNQWVRADNTKTGVPADQVPGGSPTYGEVTTENPVNFSLQVLTLASPNFNNNPLPVTLISFTAKADKGNVVLDWATASEFNNAYFEVQRSEDGFTFETIGKVAGKGTTDVRNDYQFIDKEPLIGINYYRLKQVDTNGQFEYSKVVSISFDQSNLAGMQIIAYPNPVRTDESLNIELKGFAPDREVRIQLIDMTGRVLQGNVSKTSRSGSLNEYLRLPATLSSGVYNLVIQDGEKSYAKRIVIQ